MELWARAGRRLARFGLPLCLLGLASVAGSGAVQAAAAEVKPTAELEQLYRLALSADLCGFPVTSAQSVALGHEMDRLVAKLDLGEDASDELYQKVETAMRREGLTKVCDQEGAWAKTFRDAMERIGQKK